MKHLTFDVGTNFDKNLINVIAENNKNNQFSSVFGKLKTDFLGGGRSSAFLPDITMEELRDYIELCHKNKLEFNYLINAMCMENKELEADSHFKIIELLKELDKIGVDAITITSPYLCELIKTQFPRFKVTVGLYAYAFDLNHIKRWIELGADEITLAHHVNRDFKLLKKMLLYTKGKNVTLRLIANNLCLHMCPYSIMHGTVQGHFSCSDSCSRGDIDYCLMKCLSTKIEDMSNLISSDWIRPEDLCYYEKLCEETDNFNLSIKLVERTKSTKFLTRVVEAYARRQYKGNLLDILLWPKSDDMVVQTEPTAEEMKTMAELYNISQMFNYSKIFDLPNIYIDNTKLDGFLKKFVDDYACNHKICVSKQNIDVTDSNYCSYCSSWVQRAIIYNGEQVEKWIDNCREFEKALDRSEVFRSVL